MHDIQKIILKRLLGASKLRFAMLTRGYSYEDNVVFHLKQLVKNGLVIKADQEYLITAKGVKAVTKYDLANLADTGFKTFFVGFLCYYQDNYLLKSHPGAAANFYNLPSGKPHFGEDISHALPRLFSDLTGLQFKAKAFAFHGLHLKTVKTSASVVLFDDAFAIYKVKLGEKDFDNITLKKDIVAMSVNKIAKLANRWPEVDYCILQKDKTSYRSYEFVSDYVVSLSVTVSLPTRLC